MKKHRWVLRVPLLLTVLLIWLTVVAPVRALDPGKSFYHYVRNTWSLQQGLPQISVQAITQDRRGYLWVGTQSGLARFDGIRFVTYSPKDTPGIPGILIRSLYLDKTGKLWIGTYKGLAVHDGSTFSSIAVAGHGDASVLDIFDIKEINGRLMVASNQGLYALQDGVLQHQPGSPLMTQSLLPRSDGLWIGSLGGVYRFNGQDHQFLALPAGLEKAVVTSLVEAQGKLWAGTTLGLYVYGQGIWSAASTKPELQDAPTTMLLEDHDHNLWVASNAGIARFNQGTLSELIPDSNPNGFRSVISAFEDREGNLWFGSQWNGLTRLWNGWTKRYSTPQGLTEPLVWSLAKAPDGAIWVGTNNGLSVLRDGHFESVLTGTELPHPHAYNLLADADRIWIGTRRGLVLYRNGKVEHPALFEPMANAQINGIVRSHSGAVWISTTEGLFRLQGDHLDRFGTKQGLRDPRTRLVNELADGRLLVGTQDGLYLLENDRLVQQGFTTGLPPGLDVTAIHELSNGDWVIGSLDENLYVRHGEHWQQLSTEQGLPGNAAFYITEDSKGYLWLAGIRGVERLPIADLARLREGKIKKVDAEMVLNERGDRRSGQQGFCCNGAGNSKGFIDHDVLWLPSRDGVVALDTRAIVKNPVPPDVVIERLQFQDRWHDVTASEKLVLPEDARDLAFEFTAFSFQDPASVTLSYQLVGYDPDWRDLQVVSPRSVNYTNLPSGDYVFQVKAANNAGVWGRTVARLPFRITPRFQETPLFLILGLLLLGTVLYAGYRTQHHAHLAQRNLLEQQVNERTEQLHVANVQLEHASQADPLTGLHNHRYLANQIPADLAYYDREQARGAYSNHALVFAVIGFGDAFGTAESPQFTVDGMALSHAAQTLVRLVRAGDYLARWQDDCLLLVFRPTPRLAVTNLGERIRASVASQPLDRGDGQQVALDCSVGLAELPLAHDGQQLFGWEQSVELAEAALHWVRQHRGHGWALLRPTQSADLGNMLHDLRSNVARFIIQGQLDVVGSSMSDPSERKDHEV
ncbi:two-component regulator propeller domain-containing protein [Thermomonas sp.]|uniref:two-component regulator propeller domain-containing protein n=1 Tax=Thermomonas sp. TaxID=1971895 RepID=UPI002489DC5F|nr:two-component regulator propeller domain-containing protein [Thermomonas sp.]MDI1254150.1 two-component regulator propeller domain-containing protein [Thermomonas sp.]